MRQGRGGGGSPPGWSAAPEAQPRCARLPGHLHRGQPRHDRAGRATVTLGVAPRREKNSDPDKVGAEDSWPPPTPIPHPQGRGQDPEVMNARSTRRSASLLQGKVARAGSRWYEVTRSPHSEWFRDRTDAKHSRALVEGGGRGRKRRKGGGKEIIYIERKEVGFPCVNERLGWSGNEG